MNSSVYTIRPWGTESEVDMVRKSFGSARSTIVSDLKKESF